jgi:integrase
MNIVQRGKKWTLRQRVPTRYASIESRAIVWVSLHTDSETIARQKATLAWAQMIEAWEAKLAGDTSDAEKRFAAARELAQKRGFQFLPAAQVAKLPREEILRRVEAAVRNGEPDKVEAAAVLGGAKEPLITVLRAQELYETLAKDKVIGKSEDQRRRWRNPLIKATENFIKVVANKPLAEITGDDMLDFRQWWIERIEAEDLTPNSANKDFTHLGTIWRTVNQLKRLGLILPLDRLKLKEGEKRTRPPFSDEWIKTKLLALDALSGLNKEARCILLAMINTGCRPSELAGLLPDHIVLDAMVPRIMIRPEGRQLKNAPSNRDVPLVGISLEAMRECRQGFPTYRFKDRLADTVNKYLRENELRETEAHSLYSLRHAFEDRMLAAGFDERIRADLFGHAIDRERYGKGATLEHKHRLLQSIAL